MKMRTMIALAASLLLTACAAPAEEAEEAAPAADGEAPVSQEEADTLPEPREIRRRAWTSPGRRLPCRRRTSPPSRRICRC